MSPPLVPASHCPPRLAPAATFLLPFSPLPSGLRCPIGALRDGRAGVRRSQSPRAEGAGPVPMATGAVEPPHRAVSRRAGPCRALSRSIATYRAVPGLAAPRRP